MNLVCIRNKNHVIKKFKAISQINMTNTYNINPVTDHLGGSPFTRGAPDGTPDGTSDGTPDGTSDGTPDGTSWQQS